jgi:hypothetical protein
MWTLGIDDDRRKLLVLRKMIDNLEKSIEEMKDVAKEMEEHLFDEYEAAMIKRAGRIS